MIGYLHGKLVEKNPPTLCLDVQGVGYEVNVSMTTFYQLPELEQSVKIYTHLSIREDAHLLFGFFTPEERTTFRQLIKVSGIGARTALAILSSVTADELAMIVSAQDANRLVKVPGIGKKTAERLLLELKDKLILTETHNTAANNHQNDVLQALIALGYAEKEVLKITRDLPSDTSVSDGIRLALKHLSR